MASYVAIFCFELVYQMLSNEEECRRDECGEEIGDIRKRSRCRTASHGGLLGGIGLLCSADGTDTVVSEEMSVSGEVAILVAISANAGVKRISFLGAGGFNYFIIVCVGVCGEIPILGKIGFGKALRRRCGVCELGGRDGRTVYEV